MRGPWKGSRLQADLQTILMLTALLLGSAIGLCAMAARAVWAFLFCRGRNS